jgi:hypothetical protein
MTKYLFILSIILFSCTRKHSPKLLFMFTLTNKDTIQEIKSFQLISLTEKKNTTLYTNTKSIGPNAFFFDDLNKGLYLGLIRLEYKGQLYDISIDSILIHSGDNVITKELYLAGAKSSK